MESTLVSNLAQPIQYMLAPAVMISSSALLLMGCQNRLTALTSRFRALNLEKRQLENRASKDPLEEARLFSVSAQTAQFFRRAGLVKNAIFAIYAGILCFAGTSVFIYFEIFTQFSAASAGLYAFLAGFFLIFAAILFLMFETALFYRIISIEAVS